MLESGEDSVLHLHYGLVDAVGDLLVGDRNLR